MADPSFLTFVLEVLAPLGRLSARRMFGGHGLFHEGLMFGLVFREQLYLKVDGQSQQQFEAAGLPPFSYTRQGKVVALSFHRAPDSVFDEPDQARHWGRLALDAAFRVKTAKSGNAARSAI